MAAFYVPSMSTSTLLWLFVNYRGLYREATATMEDAWEMYEELVWRRESDIYQNGTVAGKLRRGHPEEIEMISVVELHNEQTDEQRKTTPNSDGDDAEDTRDDTCNEGLFLEQTITTEQNECSDPDFIVISSNRSRRLGAHVDAAVAASCSFR